MVVATLTRGGQTVELPLLDVGGTPLLISDFGKPEAQLRTGGGSLDPRVQDQYSGSHTINLIARYVTSDAYERAIELCDFLKSDSSGEDMLFNVDVAGYDDDILVTVGAGDTGALQVDYAAGRKNDVEIGLNLTRISVTQGSGSRSAETPTATGDGPIQIGVGNSLVDLSADATDISLTRSIGRPQDVVRRTTQAYPRHINKPKITNDTLELSFVLTENVQADLETIQQNIFEAQLGRSGITLDFNGIFGLGAFEVMPTGSSPFRQVRQAGQKGQVITPTFEFRRVFSQS